MTLDAPPLTRMFAGSARYDSLHYHYHDDGGRRQRNRLYHLQDLAADGIVTAPDPDDLKKTTLAFDTDLEEINTAVSTNNYRYDALGNLVRDDRAHIEGIEWTVAGKVKRVVHETGEGPGLEFAYGASGQRTLKQVSDPDLDDAGYREHYIRDAQGNIMATYRYSNTTADGMSLKLNDRPLYGSSRLGSLRKEEELYALPSFDHEDANPVQQVDLNYELTDHLGNVCAVVTGRLLDGNGGGTPKQAELVSAQGYEPGGSLLPGRNFSSSSYNYGFQGQIKDDEIHGSTGTSYAFEYRMHDPRIGRFLSIDPLVSKYPYWSPYAFSGNRVIDMIELEGLEPTTPVSTWNVRQDLGDKYGTGGTVLMVSDAGSDVAWEVVRYQSETHGALWTYKDPSKPQGSRWSTTWQPTGRNEALPAAQFGPCYQDNADFQFQMMMLGRRDAARGGAFSDAYAKGMLNLALGLTTGGIGGQGFDILSNGAQQLAANGGDWDNLDVVDMAAAGLPSGADILVSSSFDLTPSGKWQSVFGEKSVVDAAIEGGWGLGGKMVPVGDVGSRAGRRLTEFTTGVGENMGSDLVKGAVNQ
ncbi:MAG: hypothetical protein IPP83_12145 [Flavobacteriales bacterium]|nr:hypothetical protein [Flavobacteriales bacterium]